MILYAPSRGEEAGRDFTVGYWWSGDLSGDALVDRLRIDFRRFVGVPPSS